ncbi:MlaA family lipoprotein [Candidatus Pelagibacter communis]|uniref:MlaA family lipoprotein n=1 Tax=Pelagibacter ubique TaxID=198252 RepID=UPI00094CF363|nr:VacJ family lipoprotein [Candidatus Pelagibacter ubique]
MRYLLKILIIYIFTINFAFAGADGEVSFSKKTGEVKDCFESVNRATFAFNQGLDNIIFEPLAKGYRKLPNPIKIGTGNVLSNISNLITIPNNILQGEFKTAGVNTARLAVNTTVGIFGIFDVASQMGFIKDYKKEDYGQTLGTWGIGEGCYLVLPVLGPSTIRDLSGNFANILGADPWYNLTIKNDTRHFKESDYYFSKGGDGLNFRAKNIDSFENLEKNSMDFYASVRSLYLQDRRKKILNSDSVTESQDDSDWDEIQSN